MELFDRVKVTASPHVRSSESVTSVMLDVIIALIPALLVGVYFYGLYSLFIVLVCMVSAVGFEALIQKLLKRKITVHDLSAAVTGMLLGFNLPPTVPLWVPVVGSGFAIIIVKQLFGGMGQNFLNPALGARVFLMASWPAIMMRWSGAIPGAFKSVAIPDAISGATPLEALMTGSPAPSLFESAIGSTAGTIGEASAIALALGGVYLLIRRTITWHIPVTYILTVAVMTFIMGPNRFSFEAVGYHVLTGGLMLGAFFMATDYSSCPVDVKAQAVFGVGCGVITAVLRMFGPSAEGASYAILIMNLVVPLLDKAIKPKLYGEVKAK